MSEFPQTILKTLYKSSDINRIWRDNASQPVICHPQKGWISPNKYREIGKSFGICTFPLGIPCWIECWWGFKEYSV